MIGAVPVLTVAITLAITGLRSECLLIWNVSLALFLIDLLTLVEVEKLGVALNKTTNEKCGLFDS